MESETKPEQETTEEAAYLSPFIEDGYSERQTIPAKPGHWSAIQISFRPLSAEDDSLVYARKGISSNPNANLAREYAAVMVGDLKNMVPARLLGWDLKDRKGNRVPITVDNLCKCLPPDLFDAILNVMLGKTRHEPAPPPERSELKN